MHMCAYSCTKWALRSTKKINTFYEIRFQELAGVAQFFSDKVKLCSATGILAWTTIRTCNFKALRFQRISFTANFRSPGPCVSRQLIKACFHPHLPIQCRQILSPLLLSEIPWYDVWISLHRMGRFEEKCCHPTLPFDLVSPEEGWLEAIWACSLKNAPLSFLIPCSWSILAGWHSTHCG